MTFLKLVEKTPNRLRFRYQHPISEHLKTLGCMGVICFILAAPGLLFLFSSLTAESLDWVGLIFGVILISPALLIYGGVLWLVISTPKQEVIFDHFSQTVEICVKYLWGDRTKTYRFADISRVYLRQVASLGDLARYISSAFRRQPWPKNSGHGPGIFFSVGVLALHSNEDIILPLMPSPVGRSTLDAQEMIQTINQFLYPYEETGDRSSPAIEDREVRRERNTQVITVPPIPIPSAESIASQDADKIIQIAGLIAEFVSSGGTYRSGIGMYDPTYTWYEGQFSRVMPAEDPREAIMAGRETAIARQPYSRDEFIDIVKTKGAFFLYVLSVSDHPTDYVSAEIADQILNALHDRSSLEFRNENFYLRLSLKDEHYRYQCDLPAVNRILQISANLDHAGIKQWLMKHRRTIFLSFFAE